MGSGVNLKEFVAGFVAEADEHLHMVNRHLVSTSEALKLGRPEPRAVRELFRSLHTIKGLASMVGAEPIVDISHEMESLLRTADRRGGRLTDQELDLLLRGTSAIEERIKVTAEKGVDHIQKAPRQLIEALAIANGTDSLPEEESSSSQIALSEEILKSLNASEREQIIQASEQGKQVVLVEFQPSTERAAKGINITSVRKNLSELGEMIKVLPQASTQAPTGISFSLLLVTSATEGEVKEAAGGPETPFQIVSVTQPNKELPSPIEESIDGAGLITEDRSRSVRVDIRRLDDAMERLSGLVVTRSKLTRIAAELKTKGTDTRDLDLALTEYSRELKRLRTAITEARLVPLSELFQRIPLVVRGLTKDSSEKAVDVRIQVGSSEVDKAVADKIFPAIVHLVRNAVDHALETRQERRRLGKLEVGTLSITSENDSGTSLVLVIKDDGRGIDAKAIAQKLGRSVARNEEELLHQIATPGVSTKQDVTLASGRGMGVDIVKRTIEHLGGAISLSTTEGEGTTFTLRVPVSMTILDVMSFTANGQTFVAPVAMIEEIIDVADLNLVRPPALGRKGPAHFLIQRRGQTIPLIGLGALLYHQDGEQGLKKALVVKSGRSTIAYGVDRMLGQQEVVVRPLDDSIVQTLGTAGATDLGDGRPTLVLDLIALGSAMNQNEEFIQ